DFFSNGMFLISGPASSGRTTTFYTLLKQMGNNKKIVIVSDVFDSENKNDPFLQGISRVTSDSDSLNYILECDFDVIMFDEMDDEKKIKLSLEACLKGKSVFCTLRANDAVDLIMRLNSFDIDSDLLFSYVKGVLCQKFIKMICSGCKKLDRRKFKEHLIQGQVIEKFYKGSCCEECGQSGYKGKMVVFEILAISDSLRELIHNNASYVQLKKEAEKEKMISFRQSGVYRIKKQLTSYDEVKEL
ncbi:Flp pilus assembly complex ATPase component TadA, partial [bacterium]|nr:Flp pilus assembly complex ATPase component TadA [bacterium]